MAKLLQCVEEVKYDVDDYMVFGFIPALDGGVLKLDSVDDSTKDDLQKAAAAIRSECQSDHRAGSGGLVVDTVDPYLFPYAFEQTGMLMVPEHLQPRDCISRCGEGETVPMSPEDDCNEEEFGKYPNDMAWSRRFQWLPFDVVLDNKGEGSAR